jgi:hypothetical protein
MGEYTQDTTMKARKRRERESKRRRKRGKGLNKRNRPTSLSDQLVRKEENT